MLVVLCKESPLVSVALAVEKEGSKPAGHVVVGQELEVVPVEFKGCWELFLELMNGIKELQENGGETVVLVGIGQVVAVVESVSKSKPLFLDKDPESLNSSIVGIKTEK